jgi:hypothetical protein
VAYTDSPVFQEIEAALAAQAAGAGVGKPVEHTMRLLNRVGGQ